MFWNQSKRTKTYNYINQWKIYLDCSLLPDIKRESDINTYLLLWAEEKLQFEEIPTLNPLYNQIPNADTVFDL
jgi:hypothetical protein